MRSPHATPERPPLGPRRLAPLLLGLGALLGSPTLVEAAPRSASLVQSDRGRTHLIHLESGKILRAPARPTGDGGWELRNGSRWVPFPASAVRRAVLEKDVLTRARELERELGREPEPARVAAYADWLVREGLYKEALSTLDRVLSEDPDCAPARDLLARTDLPLALPAVVVSDDPQAMRESLHRFFAKAPSTSPTAREMAAQRLIEQGEVPGLIEALRTELVHPSARHRTFAAFLMRRIVPGHEVRPLLNRAVLDSSSTVRHEASLALRDVQNEAVIVPVVRALGSERAMVRANAIGALGTMGYSAAVEPLVTHLASSGSGRAPHANIFVGGQIAYVSDYDVEVAQNSSIADPTINVLSPGATLDAAVLGVTDVTVRAERAAAMRSLESLTGVSPGRTVRAWQAWWETHGDAWLAEHPPLGAPASPRSPER